jgi:SOS-response transcriptional repressor LexA
MPAAERPRQSGIDPDAERRAKALAEWLSSWLSLKGWDPKRLAEETHKNKEPVSYSRIINIKNGSLRYAGEGEGVKIPRRRTLVSLATALGAPVAEALRIAGHSPEPAPSSPGTETLLSLPADLPLEARRAIETLIGVFARPALAVLPVVERVQEGATILASENLSGNAAVPRELVEGLDPCSCFAFRMRDTSMTGAGILEGDLLILRKSEGAENGQVVLLLQGGELLVRRAAHSGGKLYLETEPARGKRARVELGDGRILAVVVGLNRKLE